MTSRDVVEAAISPQFVASNSKGISLNPSHLLGAEDRRIDFARIAALEGQSVLSARQFDHEILIELCKFAALLEMTEIAQHHPLDGKLAITAFFEASTRTRLSFESAVLRLDGKIVSVPDGKVTGIAKGESLADIGEMFNTYGDVVIMRHPETSSVEELRRNLDRPLINAGNGTGEHPTQALVDWYTLVKWHPALTRPDCQTKDRIRLGIVGSPRNMRAVKSFVLMSRLFAAHIEEIVVISELEDPVGADLAEEVRASGVKLTLSQEFESVLPTLDVVYMNSIALLSDGYHELSAKFRLHKKSPMRKGCVIMHPFARRAELDIELDATLHNLYFAQAASAVYIRQALLVAILGRLGALPSGLLYLAR